MNVDAALFIIVTKERKQRGLLLPHFIGRCLIFFFHGNENSYAQSGYMFCFLFLVFCFFPLNFYSINFIMQFLSVSCLKSLLEKDET